MRLIGIMPVKNEGWVLGLSARVALSWVDELVIGLHDCTDESETICHQIETETDRLFYIDLPGQAWDEMSHRQRLLEAARRRGATHIAIIDADEVITANLSGGMRRMIPQSAGLILQLPGYNLRGGMIGVAPGGWKMQYHNNGVWGKRWFSLAFQDDPRLSWSGDKFHSREPGGRSLHAVQPIAQDAGGIFHLWGASERRLIAKHALYKMTERIRWPNKPVADIDVMYSWAIKGEAGAYGTPETWTYAPVPVEWWKGYEDLLKYLDLDRTPWQEKACVDLMKEHGPRTFAGLDLFGVV